jgi:hypothetical protein
MSIWYGRECLILKHHTFGQPSSNPPKTGATLHHLVLADHIEMEKFTKVKPPETKRGNGMAPDGDETCLRGGH